MWRHDVSLWVAENVAARRNTRLEVSTSVQLNGKAVRVFHFLNKTAAHYRAIVLSVRVCIRHSKVKIKGPWNIHSLIIGLGNQFAVYSRSIFNLLYKYMCGIWKNFS